MKKSKKVQVSVIMPSYNSANTILDAIKSVIYQDIDTELIIIDDCSDDNTLEVIKQISTDKLDNFNLIYLKNSSNMGVAYSRNLGIDIAQGEYIAFLDSDDIWQKDKLKDQIKMLQKSDFVLCATARQFMKNDGTLTNKVIPVPCQVDYKKLLLGNVINCSSVLIRTSIMKKYKMTDDDIHEDYITWLRILKNEGKAIFLKKPYLLYRLSDSGKSSNKIKSAINTFKVYRRLNINMIHSIYYFIRYAISAIIKYM